MNTDILIKNKTQGFRVELQVSGGGVTGKGRYRDKTETRLAQKTAFRCLKKFSGGGGWWVGGWLV